MCRRTPVLFTLLLTSAVGSGQHPDTPAAVAAKKRQEAIRTIEVVFTITETVEPGSLTPLRGGPFGTSGKGFPAERQTIRSTNRLLVDGDRVRFDYAGELPKLMAWLGGDQLDDVTIEPQGLGAIYRRYHAGG